VDAKTLIFIISGFVSVVLVFIFIGKLLWKLPSIIDYSMIKDFGKFFYLVMCKSGFMVILIIIATYLICLNSPSIPKKDGAKDVSRVEVRG
jgi:hypothetical protein